ncbi:PilC/PilY family type IV pilus protein [Sessilibacter corallicola]|uniref:PilC/PilY family type IV pilus protein n=2 Tax=Sessilibacter corallicola TaxID=2904075 RepID=A0ABQ0A7B5_9GAMM
MNHMSQSKRKFSHLTTQLSLTAAITFATCHSAFAVDLPDRPLLTEASIEPNVMVVLDDSGSMVFGFSFGSYDPGINYGNCPSSLEIPTVGNDLTAFSIGGSEEIEAQTDSDGNAFFTYRGVDYAWGFTPGIDGRTGLPQRCFRRGGSYRVQYSDDFDNRSALINSGNFTAFRAAEGNFWNFYFSNEDQTDGDNWGEEDQKFGVGERIELAQDAAKILMRNLDGVRIGLAGFDGSEGGRILAGIDSIDRRFSSADGDTHRQLIIDRINTINANGATPLGETLAEVSRYFVEGFTNQQVVLHPDNITGSESSANLGSLLPNRPRYEFGVQAPTASDPVVQAFCQENFTVLLTDGAPTQDNTISNGLANYDADGATGVFDDIALAVYDIDLRPDLNEFDGSFVRNNMSTYVIAGFGLGEQTVIRNVVNNGVGFGVDPGAEPGILYQANSGVGLVDAFDDIFEEIFSNAGSLTSVTFNSGSLELDTALYQATFSRAEFLWKGNLLAFPFDESTQVFSTTPMWNAANVLDDRVAAAPNGHLDRDIITMSSSGDGMAFTAANYGALSAMQRNDLSGGTGDSTVGIDVLNYIRGESNPLFRDRTTFDGRLGLLGDIVNSSPIEVGEPEINYPDFGAVVGDGSISQFGTATRPYSSFRSANANRESMVYSGSNDGMLHAFRGNPENGGQEAFAYVPSMVFDDSSTEEGLFYLTNTEYDHRFYVDGALTASDIFIDPDGGTNKSWRTVLIGALRAGGKGIYALDITDPTSISEENARDAVLWEFSGVNDDDMGHVYGDIRVAKMANGKWAAILGNGYNSTSREAKVFIIFFEEGADGSFTAGDWVELDTGVGGDNGMSTPVLADLDGNFIPDRIYAGDLRGNMWVFDVSDPDQDNWESAYMTSGDVPQPLFTARNSNGDEQPITTVPIITRNNETVSTGNGANVLVFFGTGQFIEIGDYTDTNDQSFYAVWDRGDAERDRNDLEPRVLNSTVITNAQGDQVTTRTVSGDDVIWFNASEGDGEWGWFMDFPEPGERVVVEPSILQGTLFFASSVPTTSACSNGGRGFLNSVSTTGLAPTTPLFDVDRDGLINEDDIGFVGEAVLGGLPSGAAYIGGGDLDDPCPSQNGQYQAYSTSSGEIQYRWVCPQDAPQVGRLSWQEMLAQ